MELVHIREVSPSSVTTLCGLNWAINFIGNVEQPQVLEYALRPDVRICTKCSSKWSRWPFVIKP